MWRFALHKPTNMMFEEKDKVVRLDLGVSPEAGVSGALLLQNEYAAYLTFNAMRPRSDGMYEEAGIAIVEFIRCSTTKFGYPNDEAIGGHPLSSKGLEAYDIFEVLNSSWIIEQEKQNRISFPDRTHMSWKRHFIFTFHDSTFECLAQDIKLTISEDSYERILSEISQQVLSGQY